MPSPEVAVRPMSDRTPPVRPIPTENGNLEGPVGEQDFFRFAANLLDLDEVEIAENGVDHERDGQHQGMVARCFRSEERVERVGHNGCAGDDRDELVEKGKGVTVKHFAELQMAGIVARPAAPVRRGVCQSRGRGQGVSSARTARERSARL